MRARKVQRSVEAQDWAVGLAKSNATKFSCSEQTLFQALSFASASNGAPLAAGWEELADEHGTAYYHHADRGVSQWERPGGGARALRGARHGRRRIGGLTLGRAAACHLADSRAATAALAIAYTAALTRPCGLLIN